MLSWWAEQMRLWVDGVLVHEGDLFDTACRWPLPKRCRQGAVLDLVLELCSPLHDGALISSHLDLEPQTAGSDPEGTLLPAALELHLAADGDLPPHWADLDPSGVAAQAAVATHLHRAETPWARCIGWVMPIWIWLGFGRSLTPGRPLNAPSDQCWL